MENVQQVVKGAYSEWDRAGDVGKARSTGWRGVNSNVSTDSYDLERCGLNALPGRMGVGTSDKPIGAGRRGCD